ncbi:MAG TPA: 30S ribosomal protein S12 methylthiotransferase RimO [Spirochaetota bacterium]|nr:30S ribosomal protein S12 methylthiotransferase RimO [Spirochaetota bacterium]HOS32115.1 30S ribosomal protein S12 methylthiotransferase RimO [Spirochaetota bacterium]HOS55456.1 30S ribosomal protein S12 methylthiotransferase RimO [Spirochaetota bacterium]HPK60836.1 30S ribosomal protein S12 methylthiotransferase RimO [Spirochaetota bacterium]HQF77984.1 30S ribosomal protein S12 methylthiotransferase RimO [Spirochaetota bacterium]
MENIYLETLGCNKNQVDSEKMLYVLETAGYNIVSTPDLADIIIVNTCAFIKSAKEEAIEVTLDLLKFKESGKCKKLVVAGCLAQRYKNELIKEIPEIDLIFGVGDVSTIAAALNSPEKVCAPPFSSNVTIGRKNLSYPGSAYLKISDGCSNRCSYCSIPIIRGDLRSIDIDYLIEELKFLQKGNLKELILISQDTSSYGKDIYRQSKLGDLIKELSNYLNATDWLRVLYLHPDRVDLELLHKLKDTPNFIPYFDIPFQSGSDAILKKMNRKKTSEEYITLVENIRKVFDNPVIRSTFIVGFPGESDSDFIDTINFIKQIEIDWIGAFAYSREEDTIAGSMKNQIKSKVKTDRLDHLLSVSEEISQNKLKRFVGTNQKILIEEKVENEELYIGRFWGQAPEVDGLVVIESDSAQIGEFCACKIVKQNGNDFFGIA